ncbi:hypothetical protein EC844_103197 [Acinetobacter calcoaceticus]|uniref:Lipoprotein n=1 Tax=Acinetobacter calcoaceticus TaxID=471 RepID=A0A4R1Y2E8_ACICA|nr:hypothetical protein EC844_103197 [Acinetobacter calcoaceticus]
MKPIKPMKLTIFIPIILLTACQVTGEQTGIYQKVLGNVGVSVKNIPLVASDNTFHIYIPKSEFNERSALKGLIGSRDFKGNRDESWNIDHVYSSSYRQLFETRGKLNLCHTISPANKQSPIDSKSCSDLTLNHEIQVVDNAYKVVFKATGIDVSSDNYGFFIKNDAPNILKPDGTLQTDKIISKFGYTDFFNKKLSISVNQFRLKYEDNTKDRFENPVVYMSFSEPSRDRKATFIFNCTVSVEYSINSPMAYCHYSIFANNLIRDYRSYNTEARSFLNSATNGI